MIKLRNTTRLLPSRQPNVMYSRVNSLFVARKERYAAPSFSSNAFVMNQEYRAKNDTYAMEHYGKPQKKTLLLVTGGLAIVFGLYSSWYYCILNDSEVQTRYWIDHEGQFIQQAAAHALSTINHQDHKQWLLDNLFNMNTSTTTDDTPVIDIVVTDVKGNNSSPSRGDHFYRSNSTITYCLFADICDVDNVIKSGNVEQVKKISLQRCKTTLYTREIETDIYFLISPSDSAEKRAIRVTMSSIDNSLDAPRFYITRVAVCSTEKAFPSLAEKPKRNTAKNYSKTGLTGKSSERSLLEQKLAVGGEIVLERAVSIGGRLRSTNGLSKVVFDWLA